MIVFLILMIVLYLLINAVIALSWMADNHYKSKAKKIIYTIFILLAGLPTLLLIIIIAIIITVVKGDKHEQ